MNAYLYTACATYTEFKPRPGAAITRGTYPRTFDGCSTLILLGGTPQTAEARFTSWLTDGAIEGVDEREILTIVGAQFVDQLFTETGPVTLDWPQVCEQFQNVPEFAPEDEFEKGYWVDVNEAVPSGPLGPDLETLQRELAEDIRSGLNWSADKQFYYIVSVLSLPRGKAEPTDQELLDEAAGIKNKQLAELKATYPELADREAAALIQARNSTVAAWLWRKFAADSPLGKNPLRIDPWCGMMEVEKV